MFHKIRMICVPFLLGLLVTQWTSAAIAQDSAWRVSKSSGEIWFTTSGAQPVAVSGERVLKAGGTVRTGPSGRVLLVRGAESMLISGNSVVSIPAEEMNGLSTTVLQQAGTILLEVEKRNIQHFEVATPYLAAVVKGTQFRVTVSNTGSQVDVLRGQVQVIDYKSGQNAIVNRDQVARVSTQGPSGLSLSGRGSLNPIHQGTPRNPIVAPTAIPAPSAAERKTDERLASENAREATFAQPSAPPARTQNEQQIRIATPERYTPTLNTNITEQEWASRFVAWGKGVLGLNGRKNRDDDFSLLAVPAFAGFAIAVGAAVFKRRQKKKRAR
jgi:hypothetical protein